jgi:hypothetical protein
MDTLRAVYPACLPQLLLLAEFLGAETAWCAVYQV